MDGNSRNNAAGEKRPCPRAGRGMEHAVLIAALRRWLPALACGLGLLLAVGLTAFAARCERQAQAVRGQTLRLHILPASDSPADQTAKLRVRDALLARAELLFAGVEGRAQAQQRAARALPGLLLWAKHWLRRQHCRDTVTISITDEYFSTRKYDEYTLPAGEYCAVRVILGSGGGHNWWCCLYPQVCLAAAEGYEEPSQQDFVLGEHILRFKVVEWWQQCFGTKQQPSGQPAISLQ